MSLVSLLSDAIDRMEGPGAPRNNPGNLRAWGNLPTQGGFAVFPTLEEGRAALERQVQLNINRGLTLTEFFCGKPGVYAGYAPDVDNNNCQHYARTVSGWVGVPVNAPLSTVGSAGAGSAVTSLPSPVLADSPVPADPVFSVTAWGLTDESAGTAAEIGTGAGGVVLLLVSALVLFAASKR